MALTIETIPYLVDGMANSDAGLELAACIQNASALSNPSFLILQICLSNDQEATNFQNAILGTYGLNPTDIQFIRDGFCLSDAALASVLDNLKVVAPTFSVPAGSYGPAQSVSLSSLTVGAKIHYTTNGSTPTASSALYSSPISVSSSETIKAIAITSGLHNSSVSSAAYVINGAVATPTFDPVAGSYVGSQSVTISSATSGATLYYTTNGSTPTTASTLYSGPITVAVSETVKVLAVKANYINSAIASAAYDIS